MATVTKPIALNESFVSTELTPRTVADILAEELPRITGRDASQVSYDNTASGLTASNVQDALDEIVGDIPTVNDGTLTIQQNGVTKASFSANTASNVTADIETPTADEKTATDEFTTANGGLLSECNVTLAPVQDLHGYDNPWVGGAGKNKVPYFTSSTVANRVWTVSDDGIITITGTSTGNSYKVMNITLPAGTYQLSGGDPNGVSGTGDEYVQVDGVVVARSYGNTNQTFTLSEEKTVTLALRDFQTAGNSATHVFKPMICLTSAENPLVYEPYENICPISGHTEVKVQVKDSADVVQNEVTQSLGTTVYGGTDEVVGGSGTITRGYKKGGFTRLGYDSENKLIRITSPTDYKEFRDVDPLEISNMARYAGLTEARNSDVFVLCHYANNLYIGGMIGKEAEVDALLPDLEVCYPLATNQSLATSPTSIEALAGENNLSTPLDGQTLEGVKYKELFTFDDVKSYVDKKIPDAPTTDGTYTLQAVVSGGVPTYSWV